MSITGNPFLILAIFGGIFFLISVKIDQRFSILIKSAAREKKFGAKATDYYGYISFFGSAVAVFSGFSFGLSLIFKDRYFFVYLFALSVILSIFAIIFKISAYNRASGK